MLQSTNQTSANVKSLRLQKLFHLLVSLHPTVQNSAARLLTRRRRFKHITWFLVSSHWLPWPFGIGLEDSFNYSHSFKLTRLCISDLIHNPAHTLSSSGLLLVPDFRLKKKGEKAFEKRSPRLWNNLPEEILQTESLASFKSLIKTYTAAPDWVLLRL